MDGYTETYKEMKLVTFYSQNKAHQHVAVTNGDCEEAGTLLALHAELVKLREAKEKISLTDGACWIVRQLTERLPWLSAMLLDCFHLTEHVQAAAVALHGDTEEAREWTRARLCEFRTMSVADALGSISKGAQTARTAAARKELDRLSHYVAERIRMLGYKHAESKGWDIGSGPTEAQCKTTTKRMKISGAKWNLGNTWKMMNLIAARNSNQWTPYWSRLAA